MEIIWEGCSPHTAVGKLTKTMCTYSRKSQKHSNSAEIYVLFGYVQNRMLDIAWTLNNNYVQANI